MWAIHLGTLGRDIAVTTGRTSLAGGCSAGPTAGVVLRSLGVASPSKLDPHSALATHRVAEQSRRAVCQQRNRSRHPGETGWEEVDRIARACDACAQKGQPPLVLLYDAQERNVVFADESALSWLSKKAYKNRQLGRGLEDLIADATWTTNNLRYQMTHIMALDHSARLYGQGVPVVSQLSQHENAKTLKGAINALFFGIHCMKPGCQHAFTRIEGVGGSFHYIRRCAVANVDGGVDTEELLQARPSFADMAAAMVDKGAANIAALTDLEIPWALGRFHTVAAQQDYIITNIRPTPEQFTLMRWTVTLAMRARSVVFLRLIMREGVHGMRASPHFNNIESVQKLNAFSNYMETCWLCDKYANGILEREHGRVTTTATAERSFHAFYSTALNGQAGLSIGKVATEICGMNPDGTCNARSWLRDASTRTRRQLLAAKTGELEPFVPTDTKTRRDRALVIAIGCLTAYLPEDMRESIDGSTQGNVKIEKHGAGIFAVHTGSLGSIDDAVNDGHEDTIVNVLGRALKALLAHRFPSTALAIAWTCLIGGCVVKLVLLSRTFPFCICPDCLWRGTTRLWCKHITAAEEVDRVRTLHITAGEEHARAAVERLAMELCARVSRQQRALPKARKNSVLYIRRQVGDNWWHESLKEIMRLACGMPGHGIIGVSGGGGGDAGVGGGGVGLPGDHVNGVAAISPINVGRHTYVHGDAGVGDGHGGVADVVYLETHVEIGTGRLGITLDMSTAGILLKSISEEASARWPGLEAEEFVLVGVADVDVTTMSVAAVANIIRISPRPFNLAWQSALHQGVPARTAEASTTDMFRNGPLTVSGARVVMRHHPPGTVVPGLPWECPRCTRENVARVYVCVHCGTKRPTSGLGRVKRPAHRTSKTKWGRQSFANSRSLVGSSSAPKRRRQRASAPQ